MTTTTKDSLIVEALPGYEPEIGRLIWMLEENRGRTRRAVENIPAEAIDWVPAPGVNSIGALLYHIAGVELDWLFVEVLEQDFPPDLAALFPEDDAARLAEARGMHLEAHLQRLDTVRQRLLETFQGMTIADYRRPRTLEKYDVTPEWVLYHLLEHEAAHRGEISNLRGLRDALSP